MLSYNLIKDKNNHKIISNILWYQFQAKQQAHELQMKEIQLKAAAEANESTKQLEDYRKRASDSVYKTVDEIAKVGRVSLKLYIKLYTFNLKVKLNAILTSYKGVVNKNLSKIIC